MPRSRVTVYEKGLVAAAIVALVTAVIACATPTSLTQSVYVAEKSLNEVINGVADAHDAKLFVGVPYEQAKVVLTGAVDAVINARKAAMLKDASTVEKNLTIVNDAVAKYISYKKTGPPGSTT